MSCAWAQWVPMLKTLIQAEAGMTVLNRIGARPDECTCTNLIIHSHFTTIDCAKYNLRIIINLRLRDLLLHQCFQEAPSRDIGYDRAAAVVDGAVQCLLDRR